MGGRGAKGEGWLVPPQLSEPTSSPRLFMSQPLRRHLAAFASLGEHAPQQARAFFAWYALATGEGALPPRLKALIALAVAHAVPCPYCLDAWTKGALERGADVEECVEVAHVVAWAQARSALLHGRVVLDQARRWSMHLPGPTHDEERYHHAGLAELEPLQASSAPRAHAGWVTYEAGVFARAGAAHTSAPTEGTSEALPPGSALPYREKILIAHALGASLPCPLLLQETAPLVTSSGWGPDEERESLHVAAALRAGATLAHAALAKEAALSTPSEVTPGGDT